MRHGRRPLLLEAMGAEGDPGGGADPGWWDLVLSLLALDRPFTFPLERPRAARRQEEGAGGADDHHDHDHDGHDHDGHDHDGHDDDGGLPPAGIVAGGGIPEPGAEAAILAAGVDPAAIPSDGVGVAHGDTFRLHSLPGSTLTVFLDFDGHTTTGTFWNSARGSSFYSPAFSLDGSEAFTAAELAAIQRIWQGVAEYFSPFTINVTTEDPGTEALRYGGKGDAAYGIRVVITDELGQPWGGIAYDNSFTWSSDTPAFVYANNLADDVKYIADAAAHEAGHTLGLAHDGVGGEAYSFGHGSGATSWAPLMGVGYYAKVVQWSDGGYAGANNLQDDLAVITTRNLGVGYRADDHGDSFATASLLGGSLGADGVATVAAHGIISGSGARNDLDMFRFDLAEGGSLDLTVSAWTQVHVGGVAPPLYDASPVSMLDVALTLYDAGFQPVAVADDPGRTDAVMTLAGLAGGTYYLAVDGTGWGSPLASPPSGWSDYGSLGQYMVRGTYTPPVPELVAEPAAAAIGEDGTAAGVTLRALGTAEAVTVLLSGLDPTEGRLSAETLVLDAANGWTATVAVTGVDDRDADGAAAWTLLAEAPGFAPLGIAVTNADDDRTPLDAGAAAAPLGRRAPVATEATLAALAAEDGDAMVLTEGGRQGERALEWRWQFEGLEAGDYRLQVAAASKREAFRLEYSTDGAASWQGFAEGPGDAKAWAGDVLVVGVGESLWVRLLDAVVEGDTRRNDIAVDLLTLARLPAGAEDLLAG